METKMEYSGRVLVGFWMDRLQLQREQEDKLEKKRASGDLPEQRMERLVRSFNTKVPLMRPPGPLVECLQMNQQVQLHCPEIPDMRYLLERRLHCPDGPPPYGPLQYGLVVSATISYADFENNQILIDRIDDGCMVSCNPIREPLSRNVFIIRPVAVAKRGPDNILTYGREFYLELAHGYEKMYLRSETPLVDGQYGPKDHNPVRLSVNRDCYCKWRALYWNKRYRFETEGAPIQPCYRIVIQHVMSGMCLASEKTTWHQSIFGLEAGLSVYTYRDQNHIERSECIWNFIAGQDPYAGPSIVNQ